MDDDSEQAPKDDVDFSLEVEPYIYLYDFGLFFPSLRPEQRYEIERIGQDVHSRQEALKKFLGLSIWSYREYLDFPLMLNNNLYDCFMKEVQYRLFRIIQLQPDDVVWVRSGEFFIPLWSLHHKQYSEERDNKHFDEYLFIRAAFHRVLRVIENFRYPDKALFNRRTPLDPPEFHTWTTTGTLANRQKYQSALQNKWSLAKILLNRKLDGSNGEWVPLQALFQHEVPNTLCKEDVHAWKCTYSDIRENLYTEEYKMRHLQSTNREAMFSKISLLYLSYKVRTVKYRSIPGDISNIEMVFRDVNSNGTTFMIENLKFYVISSVLLRNSSSLKMLKRKIFEFTLMSQYGEHALHKDSAFCEIFQSELQEAAVTIGDGFSNILWEKHDRHVYHHFYTREARDKFFRLIFSNTGVSEFWSVSLSQKSLREEVRSLIPFFENLGVFAGSYIQNSMTLIAKEIFVYSHAYCGLDMRDTSDDVRVSMNEQCAKFIEKNGYIAVEDDKRILNVADIDLQHARRELTTDTKNDLCPGQIHLDKYGVQRGIGGLRSDIINEKNRGYRRQYLTRTDDITVNDLFADQSDIAAMFESFFRDCVLFYCHPQCIVREEERTNFLVFLDDFGVKEYPFVFYMAPWKFSGSMVRDFELYSRIAYEADNLSASSFVGRYQINNSNGKVRDKINEFNDTYDRLCLCPNTRCFIDTKRISFQINGLACVGLVETSAYSWVPRNSDINTDFGSVLTPIDQYPLDMWTRQILLGRNGNSAEIAYPLECQGCRAFTTQMYKKIGENGSYCSNCVPKIEHELIRIKFEQVNPKKHGFHAYQRYERYKSARDVESAIKLGMTNEDYKYDFKKGFLKVMGKELIKNIRQGWQAYETYEEYAILCCKGSSWYIWSNVPWKIDIKGDFRSLRYHNVSCRSFFAQPLFKKRQANSGTVSRKRPTFLLPPSSKSIKLKYSHDMRYPLSFDWSKEDPEILSPEWLDKQYVIRPNVSEVWKTIRRKMTENCVCYKNLMEWFNNGCRGDRPPYPSFICCGKESIDKKFLPDNNNVFKEALHIIGLDEDSNMEKLLMCDDFLQLYYTLFSQKGKETSLREAACRRGDSDVPTHEMFFVERKLSIPKIKEQCLQVLTH